MPMQRHSYHVGGAEDAKTAEDGIPNGCNVEHLALEASEWKEVEAAYLADSTRMPGVKVSDVYRMVAMGGEGVLMSGSPKTVAKDLVTAHANG